MSVKELIAKARPYFGGGIQVFCTVREPDSQRRVSTGLREPHGSNVQETHRNQVASSQGEEKRKRAPRTRPEAPVKKRAGQGFERQEIAKLIPKNIKLSEEIQGSLESWRSKLSRLFADDKSRASLIDFAPAELYTAIRAVEKAQKVDRLRIRIWSSVVQLVLGDTRTIDSILVEIARRIQGSGLIADDFQTVVQRLRQWSKEGRRYNGFCKNLGGFGALAWLPYEIGDS